MIAFWIAAALMSAAVGGLMLQRAGRAGALAAAGGEDPSLTVYRRQLQEVDDLAERGLIAAGERRSAHAEAARRLLSAADTASAGAFSAKGGRRTVLAAAALAPVAALGVYLAIGSPQTPDQPYRARVAAWRKADPSSLDPAQMAAVLQALSIERPHDPLVLDYLARAQRAAGDTLSAERSLRQALVLAPYRSDLWEADGELLAADGGADRLSDAARAAFAHALSLNPQTPVSQYYMARDRIAAGDIPGGVARLKALQASLGLDDPRRAMLESEITSLQRTGALPPEAQSSQAGTGAGADPTAAMIQGMVQGLADRLAAQPDDPAGWARLVRAYGVLGDTARRGAALAQARRLFASRPQDLAAIEAAGQPARRAAP